MRAMLPDNVEKATTVSDPPKPPKPEVAGRGWRHYFGLRNIGAIYLWILLVILFSILAPDTFPQWNTVRTVLNQNAITGIVALALVVPLSTNLFDLSIGAAVGFCNVLVAWMLVDQGMPIIVAIVLTLVSGLLIGLINGIVTVTWKIDSFIGTLATGALLAAGSSMVSGDQSIIGPALGGTFGDLATVGIGGISLPVLLMLAVAATLWYMLNYTVAGRRIYATGFNAQASRLAGIKTNKLQFNALVLSGSVAGIGGILLASQVSSGSPEIGSPYLLTAYSAVFLGATQFGGRFNAWGTVVAVLILGTGKTGLVLIGAPVWASNIFIGSVLLASLGIAKLEGNLDLRESIALRRRRRVSESEAGEQPGPS